jgi:hypothetical protein
LGVASDKLDLDRGTLGSGQKFPRKRRLPISYYSVELGVALRPEPGAWIPAGARRTLPNLLIPGAASTTSLMRMGSKDAILLKGRLAGVQRPFLIS